MKKAIFKYRYIMLVCLLSLSALQATCRSNDTDKARIQLPSPLRVDVNGPYAITVETDGLNPDVHRNLSCGGEPMAVSYAYKLQIRRNGGNGNWMDMTDVNPDFATSTITATIPEARQALLRPRQRYDLRLVSPTGGTSSRPLAILITGTSKEVPTPQDSEAYVFEPFIEAECAFGPDTGNCNGIQEGFAANYVIDVSETKYAPGCMDDCSVVVDMIPDVYVAYSKIDMDDVVGISIRYAGDAPDGYFEFVLDDKDSGDVIGDIDTYTSSMDTWKIQTVSISEYTGVHTLYIVGGFDVGDYEDNGHIDWIEMVYAVDDTDTGTDSDTQTGSDSDSETGTDTVTGSLADTEDD